MPETTTSVDAQAVNTDTTTTAQAANSTSTETQAVSSTENISLEEARKLRSEAANLRKRLKSFEDREKAVQDAQLSEVDLTKKQFAELQAQHELHVRQTQDRIVRYELEKHAARIGVIDPDAAATLLDKSELEFEEDGTPKNAEELMKKLLKNKPYLAAQPTPPSTSTKSPSLPAMNPGRSAIQSPTTQGTQKIPRLADLYRQQK